MSTTDRYGLSADVLGTHSDDFYGAVGRVVCVCAVLEDKVTSLRHTLEGVRQGVHTQQPVSKQIQVARERAGAMPDYSRDVTQYLDDVEKAFRRRNEIAHSSFPAQEGGRLWGHRPARDKNILDGTADVIETTIDELRGFIGELSDLVRRFNDVHALVSANAIRF